MSEQSSAVSAPNLHIPSLDGIRAVSFSLVFFSHLGVAQIVPGFFGVTVFFFLSGYLITTLMRLEIERTGALSIGSFYLRRAFRIVPPYYVVLFLIILTVRTGWLPGSLRGSDLAATALYMTNYWNIFVHPIEMPGFNVFWSLSVEEHFYLLFPFLLVAMYRLRLTRRIQVLTLLCICAAVLGWRCILVFDLHSLGRTYGNLKDPLRTWFATDTRVDSILFGCVLGLWGNPIMDRQLTYRKSLTFVGILVIILTFVYRPLEFRETFRYTLQSLALIPLFVSAISLHAHWAFRWLNSRLLSFLGVLSYSLYLVHLPILILYRRLFSNPLVIGIAALSTSICIAYLMHLVIEKPFTRLRRRVSLQREKTREATLGEVGSAPVLE